MKSKLGCLKFKTFNQPTRPIETSVTGNEIYTYLPIHLKASAHKRLHWTRIRAIYQSQAILVTSGLNAQLENITLPAKITLARIAPRELDFDNLVTAFKHIRDTVADLLIPGLAKGRADGDKRLQWEYMQIKGIPKEYAVKITIKGLIE